VHFTLRQLEAFAIASELQSFTKTAAHLHLTPSAVSQLVVELEAALGFRLFDRHTRKVMLSPAGRTFLPAVTSILRDVTIAKATAADVRDQAAGIVRIAAPLWVASAILPPLIAKYRASHPRIVVRTLDRPVHALVESVALREADLALGPDRPVTPDVERVPLYPSPWVVWCSPRHRFARKKSVTWGDLHRAEFVAAGADHEIRLAQIMGTLPDGQRFAASHVVDNITTALGLCAANLCYTLSPAYVAPLAQPMGLVMRPLGAPVVMGEMSLFVPSGREASPAARGFGALIRRSLRQ
jgi:DNA-binding transcriptional LysR family regulator